MKRKFWKEFYRINDAAPFLNYRVGVKSLENKIKKTQITETTEAHGGIQWINKISY